MRLERRGKQLLLNAQVDVHSTFHNRLGDILEFR